MAAKLRAVGPDEEAPKVAPPKSMAEATERSRREFLERSRLQMAAVIDAGVPAHALGRLMAELDRVDVEIRRMDAVEAEERQNADPVADAPFNKEAI